MYMHVYFGKGEREIFCCESISESACTCVEKERCIIFTHITCNNVNECEIQNRVKKRLYTYNLVQMKASVKSGNGENSKHSWEKTKHKIRIWVHTGKVK